MRLLAATLACLVAFAAGAAAVAAAPTRLPAPYEFILIYERSGGIAASTRSLVVAPGQFATAESSGTRAGKRHADFRLSGRRIRALERGLRRAHFASLKSPEPSGCADCFEYEILQNGHLVELDESQVPRRLGPVLAQIEAIITAHTSSPKA